MKGFFQDEKGNKSMVRLLAFIGHVVGAVGLIVSIVLKSTQGIIASAALMAGGEIAKTIQKKFEGAK